MIAWPISDLVDRLSILLLKQTRAPTPQIDAECDRLGIELRSRFINYLPYLESLLAINGQIWDLEADIRQGKEGDLGLEEVGRRALAIRDLNAKRVQLKNAVAGLVDEFEDVKVNHASAA